MPALPLREEFIMSFDQDGDGKISYDEIIDDALNNPQADDEAEGDGGATGHEEVA